MICLDEFLSTYRDGVSRHAKWQNVMEQGMDPSVAGVGRHTYRKWCQGTVPEPVRGLQALEGRGLWPLQGGAEDFFRLASLCCFEGQLRHDYGIALYPSAEHLDEVVSLVERLKLRPEKYPKDIRVFSPPCEGRQVAAKAVGRLLKVFGVKQGRKAEGMRVPPAVMACVDSNPSLAMAFFAELLNTSIWAPSQNTRMLTLPLQYDKADADTVAADVAGGLSRLIGPCNSRTQPRTTDRGLGYTPCVYLTSDFVKRARSIPGLNGRFSPDYYTGIGGTV